MTGQLIKVRAPSPYIELKVKTPRARFDKIKRLSYFAVTSFSAITAGCSVYTEDAATDGGASSIGGAGGTTLDGGSSGSGGVGPDASTGGAGGSTGGAVGSGGSSGGSGGGKGGTGGKGGSGGAAGSGAGGGTGGTNPGDASTTGGAGGTGGAVGTGGTTGGASGAGGDSGPGGASGNGGTGGATGGAAGATGGTGGATGGAAGTGGATGGTGGSAGSGGSAGAKDAGPEAPPPPGAAFDVGSFVKSAASGNQVVPHALGHNPKAVILWTAGKTNETLSAGFYYGIGVTDSTMSVSLAMSSRDALSTSSSSRRIANKAITLVQGGNVTVAEADFAASNGNSFTLNWALNDGQPYVIHYIAIGGPQVSAKIVNWQTPTAPGSKSVTGFGFQPEAVLHFYAGAAFIDPAPFSSGNAVLGMGAMDKTGAQWAIQASDANAQNPTVASRAQRNNAAIYMYTDTGTTGVTKDAAFVSMSSSGFTLNFTTANANAGQVYSLALAGLRAGVGTFNKTTAAAPASQSVSSGFSPGAVLLASYQMGPQTAASSESHCSFGLGASDGTTEAASAMFAGDAVATSVVEGQDKTSKVFIKMNTPPLDAEADMASFGPSGFTLNWTTNDATASQICFLALGAP